MFTGNFEHLFGMDALHSALQQVKTETPGIDDQKAEALDDVALADLREALLSGSYTPQPIRKIELPKEDGETRPIAVASLRDKVVQRVLADALTPWFDRTFSDKSYGYRAVRSADFRGRAMRLSVAKPGENPDEKSV
jgi:RNA-directed DNA polymerase